MRSVLSSEEIQHFQEHGFVRLGAAFEPDSVDKAHNLAWHHLERHYGYVRNSPESWQSSTGGLGKRCRRNKKIWSNASSRLTDAITQLLGPDWKEPIDWGRLLFTVPDKDTAPWNITADMWHCDADPFQFIDGGKGLFTFNFLSEVKHEGGGTLIVGGSPNLLLRFYRTLSGRERRGKILLQRFFKSHPWFTYLTRQVGSPDERIKRLMNQTTVIDGTPVRVVELTGKPGDAVLCHPVILHAGSQNRARVPRAMRAQTISMKERISTVSKTSPKEH